ncbi:hypothetical protein FLP10_15055 [Agromyces intestinalis]|uniref:Uncharacterized protein n=1 Tax=Agromyces intestinalis TaxID=2592652 RepID=A0A5C1YKE1_9MICO|nr:hypothetical protein [Agromyces intestinalis]QEO15599.1 hypothetical protein FLP10_15055 [Agromyces intestinalis]
MSKPDPAIAPSHDPALAYRVPWRVDRSHDPWFSLVNESDEPLNGVHLTLSGDGRLMWRPLLSVPPGESVSFVVHADDPARNTIACVRWFRPDGGEYLWRVSF